MLGNLIGGFIVILVGKQKSYAHYRSNSLMHNSRISVNPLNQMILGQDRSVNVFTNAQETDKGNLNGWIYSPNSEYRMKSEITKISNFSSNGRENLLPIKDGNF